MLSLLTHTAIAVLGDISLSRIPLYRPQGDLSLDQFGTLLNQLCTAQLIRRAAAESGYELTRLAGEITLLDILCATNQHLNCNHETHEDMYLRYRLVANRLGVINSVTRTYLSEIKLTDF